MTIKTNLTFGELSFGLYGGVTLY